MQIFRVADLLSCKFFMVQIFCIASLLCGKTFVMQASVMQARESAGFKPR